MTFRELHPRLAAQFERKMRDICAALERPELQIMTNFVVPELDKIKDMYEWLLNRLIREHAGGNAYEHGLGDLAESLTSIQYLFMSPGFINTYRTKLLKRCEEFLRMVTRTSTNFQ